MSTGYRISIDQKPGMCCNRILPEALTLCYVYAILGRELGKIGYIGSKTIK